MQLNVALEGLLEDFLKYRRIRYCPAEMEATFEEWIGELVHTFVTEKDWEEIAAECREDES